MKFEKLPLGDVATFYNNLRKPVTRSDRDKGEFPYYGAAGIQDYVSGYIFDGEYILVGEDGTVITKDENPVVQIVKGRFWVNNHAHVIRPKVSDDFNYLYYALKTAKVTYLVTGAVQPKLSMTNLKSLMISWPESSAVRREIGETLSLFDQKIQNNECLSATLEQIAQTIFKSWFIDFDPVKAKMAGEAQTGLDASTTTLFPDSIEESEYGLIPKGWGWGTIGDIAQVIDCLHSKKPELVEVGHPYLQLDTIADNGVLKFDKAAKISEEDYKKWTSRIEVAGGDCLITNVGRVGAVSQVPDNFKAAIGRNLTAIRPKEKFFRTFLICALTSDYMKREINRNTDSGTILEALNVRNIPKLRVPIPSDKTLMKFEEICGAIWQKIQFLHMQNVQLTKIRDSLLPRLISGQLQIPEEMMAS